MSFGDGARARRRQQDGSAYRRGDMMEKRVPNDRLGDLLRAAPVAADNVVNIREIV